MNDFTPMKRRVTGSVINSFMLLTCLLVSMSVIAQTRVYVNANATGTNSGTSWTNAYTSLQSAMEVATSGDEIWVAGGVYKPTKDISGNASPSQPRAKTFYLKDGIKLYGGFSGTETLLSQRVSTLNGTILSGDLDSDDGPNFTNNGDNAFHVVAVNSLSLTTIIDGFTITAGNSDDASDFLGEVIGNYFGAGLFARSVGSYLLINNCVFKNNKASGGGGVFHGSGSSSTISNSVFIGNFASSGGGIYNTTSLSEPIIVNCVFVSNTGSSGGGGVYNLNSRPQIINCTFTDNHSNDTGGAIHNGNTFSGVVIKNCIIWGNTATNSNASIGSWGTNSPQVSYSNVEGGFAGTGNIDQEPVFSNSSDLDGGDNVWRTADDGLILVSNSPSANTGSNGDIPAGILTDIIGDARIQNSDVNMGAYEKLKLGQTVTLDAIASKTYGDGAFTVSGSASSGLPLTYTVLSGPATMSGAVLTIAGAGTVTVRAIQNGDNDFAPSFSDQSFTVSPRAITISALSISKVYGNPDPAIPVNIVSGSLVGGDTFTGALGRVTGEDVGTYTITQGTLSNSDYTITFLSGKVLSITQRPVTVSADAKSKIYGDTDPALTLTLTGGSLVGGDAITGTLVRVAGENVGEYQINQGTVSAGTNYSITFMSASLTITQRPITLTADANTKVYGSADPPLTYSLTSGALIGGDMLSGVLSRVEGENTGGYQITRGTVTAGGNYFITLNSANFTITPRPITVQADAKTKSYGDVDPAMTYTITSGSLVTGDQITGSLMRVAGENPGSYLILLGTLSAGANYSITFLNASLVINKGTQSIAFPDLGERALNSGTITLPEKSTADLLLTYVSSNTTVATVTGNVITLLAEGETIITASQNGNDVYESATPVSRTLIVKLITDAENDIKLAVKVYPNPTAGLVQIKAETAFTGPAPVLFDAHGRILTVPVKLIDPGTYEINILQLPVGVYFVRIQYGDELVTRRIVRE